VAAKMAFMAGLGMTHPRSLGVVVYEVS